MEAPPIPFATYFQMRKQRQRLFKRLTKLPVHWKHIRDWNWGLTLGQALCSASSLTTCPFHHAGMVLGTLFIGGSLVAGQQLTGGDLMSFLVASQTVQR